MSNIIRPELRSEMNEKIAILSREHSLAQKAAEDSQKAAHAADERANAAEAAQRAVMVEIISQIYRDQYCREKSKKLVR